MSRLSNVSTLKIGIFRSWNTYWFDQLYYSNVLFHDLKIKDYLSGIFYKLRVISDYLHIYRLLNNNIVIQTNLIFFSNIKFKSLSMRNVHKMNPYFSFFYRKKYWVSFLYFLKTLKVFTSYNNYRACQISNLPYHQCVLYYISYVLFIYRANSVCYSLSFMVSPISQEGIYCYSFVKNYQGNFQHFPISNALVLLQSVHPTVFFTNNNFIFGYRNLMARTKWFNLFHEWYTTLLLRHFFISMFSLCKFYYYFLTTTYEYNRVGSFLLNAPLSWFTNIDLYASNHWLSVSSSYLDKIPSLLIKRNITKSLFNALRYNIESTISKFEQQDVYFNFSISFKQNPYLISAKMITDTLVYLLQAGQKIVKSFFFIRNWQADCYFTRRSLEHLYNSRYADCLKYGGVDITYLFHYATKQSPLIGIRIECSGTFKKGKMSKVYFYNSWVKDDMLTGRMPNTSTIADIDYYQYFAVSKSSSLGIKTWIFLETHIYNNNHKYISLIY